MRPTTSPRGQSLVEFALTFPILLLLALGTVDLGRALHTVYQTNRLSREGANRVSRGVSLTDREITRVITDLTTWASPSLDMAGQGVIIVSILEGRRGGAAQVVQQVTRGRIRVQSLAGHPGDLLDGRPLEPILHGEVLPEGQWAVLVEVYYRFDPITPVDWLFGVFRSRSAVFGSQAVFFFS